MTKAKIKFFSVTAVVIIVVLGIIGYIRAGIVNTSHGVNGFSVINKIVRMSVTGEEIVKLGENKFLYKGGNFTKLIKDNYEYISWLGGDMKETAALGSSEQEIYKATGGTIVKKDGNYYKRVASGILYRNIWKIYFEPNEFELNYKTNCELDGNQLHIFRDRLYFMGKDTRGFVKKDSVCDDWTRVRLFKDKVMHVDVCDGAFIYLTSHGDVYALGTSDGIFGQQTSVTTPQLLMQDCKYASVGNGFVLFVKNDGSLWFMGESKNGQSTQISNRIEAPVQIAKDVVYADAFGYTSCWITENGDLYLVGDNSYGQIGNGHKGNGSPELCKDVVTTPYLAFTDCIDVRTDDRPSARVTATKRDGSSHTWGNNTNHA